MRRNGVLFLSALVPLGFLSGASSARTDSCPKVPNPRGTVHSANIGGDETWSSSSSPHLVSEDITITATLTIEPCSEVLIGADKTITVTDNGRIIAHGEQDRPISIHSQNDGQPFAQIYVHNGGTLRLRHTVIAGGGAPFPAVPDVTGTIVALGADQDAPAQPTVFVEHVTIRGSKSNGLYLAEGAGFAPGSQYLTVSGAAQYPVSIWPRSIGTLPTGKYTGNAIDAILVPGIGGAASIQEDATMRNHGVPYQIGNSLTEGLLVIQRQQPNSGVATLTIEAGVTIRVKKGGVIEVQHGVADEAAQGALVVGGTRAKPVVFTSAEPRPAAGDWLGIWFGGIPAANNLMRFARVEYAGGESGAGSGACNPDHNDAAIRIFGVPSTAFVTNTTIANSAGHGIDRGWSNDSKLSFLSTNTMTGIARCQESWPRDTDGQCPSEFVAPLQCWPQETR